MSSQSFTRVHFALVCCRASLLSPPARVGMQSFQVAKSRRMLGKPSASHIKIKNTNQTPKPKMQSPIDNSAPLFGNIHTRTKVPLVICYAVHVAASRRDGLLPYLSIRVLYCSTIFAPRPSAQLYILYAIPVCTEYIAPYTYVLHCTIWFRLIQVQRFLKKDVEMMSMIKWTRSV